MQPDLETYLPYMDGLDLTLAQKKDIIHTVWAFMESQVDQVFGVHPVQQACEKVQKRRAITDKRQIESKHSKDLKIFNATSTGS